MAEIVSGLFGLDPMQIRQQEEKQRQLFANQFAQTYADPYEQANALRGGLLGNAIASFAGGLFGLQSPELKRATTLENILQQTQQEVGSTDPAVLYPALQKRLADAGFGREATQVGMAGQKAIQEAQLNQAKVLSEQAQAKERETQSGYNIARTVKELQPELTNIEKLLEAKDRLTKAGRDTSVIDATIAKETQGALPSIDQRIVQLSTKKSSGTLTEPEKQELDYLDNFKNRVASSSAARNITTVAMGKAEDKFAELAGKYGLERQSGLYDTARGAVNNLSKIDTTINLLKTSDARTGFGAEVIKNIDRAVAALGGKEAAKKASDTELLNALLGSEVFPQIGALGIGARGLDTPAEREFLREVMAGTISMNKDTLIRMAEIRRNIEKRALDNYNQSVDSGELDAFFNYSKTPKQKFTDPSIAKVGNKEYKRPANFTDAQWQQYKQSVGAQ